MTAQLKIFAPLWGSNDLAPEQFIQRAIDAGFDGVEISLPDDEKAAQHWLDLLAQAKLPWIGQQWQTVFARDFTEHQAILSRTLEQVCAAQPLKVNSHTGKDFYTQQQNLLLIDLAEAIATRHGVELVHEIHRSRFTAHPLILQPYLQLRPTLRLNADLSHWCCVCESLLEDQEEMLEQVFAYVSHIHARVGFQQGPQVNDFRAPEHALALQRHLGWWRRIIARQLQAGTQVLTITPEFGPAPYTQSLPYTQAVVSDSWQLNVAMRDLLNHEFAAYRSSTV